MRKPYARWSEDTETAFLLALRQTGTVRAAAAAIGRAEGSAYKRRQRRTEFAARWDAALDAWQREWIERKGEVPGVAEAPRERWDGLSRIRKRAFLRALSDTGSVREACARVGVAVSTVTRLKARSPDFAEACVQALDRSLPAIEQVAWERAVEGWDEEIVQGGKVTGTRRRYSESLLRALLVRELAARREERAAAAKAGAVPAYATPDETDTRLLERLTMIERRRDALQRREALARAEAWERFERAVAAGEREGLVPGGGPVPSC